MITVLISFAIGFILYAAYFVWVAFFYRRNEDAAEAQVIDDADRPD